jgi:methylphosphotriester-DNA--protein-cysteine methyltransferase
MSKQYRLVGRDGAEYLSPAKGLVGGNRRGKIYGRLDCPSALQAIAKGDTYRKHRVFFADAATAVAAGYRPCGACLRAEYKLWRARQRDGSN